MTADTPAASKDAPTDERSSIDRTCNEALQVATGFLEEAARYFENRPTNGEDRAHWANVQNAENCRKVATHVAALTSKLKSLQARLEDVSAQLEAERATGDETARHISRLLDHLARETARADAAVAEAKALREAAEPFVRAADAAERNCFPLDGAVFRSALDYDMRALGRDNSEDVYRDSVRTSDLYRLRSIVTRATLAQPAADGGAT